MPRFDWAAAGSMPRMASNALALTADRHTESRGAAPLCGVEPLGLAPRPPHEVAVARRAGVALGEVLEEQGVELGIGVEHAVQVAHVAGAHLRLEDLGVPV